MMTKNQLYLIIKLLKEKRKLTKNEIRKKNLSNQIKQYEKLLKFGVGYIDILKKDIIKSGGEING